MIIAIHAKTASNPESIISEIETHGWKVCSFMDTAREFVHKATGIPIDRFYDSSFVNLYLGSEWSYTREERFINKAGVSRSPVRYHLSPKMILTKMYELGREIHSNFWVNALLHSYNPNVDKWIVFIMYPNEFAAVKELKAETIFYDMSGMKSTLDPIKNQFDIIINSPTTLHEKLEKRLK